MYYRINLSLRPEIEAFLQQQLSTSRFQDPNDVIETALHAMADQRAFDLTDLDVFALMPRHPRMISLEPEVQI